MVKISEKNIVPVVVVDKVYNAIKDSIFKGEYLPGMHLVETDLTNKYKVSRVTIRDALRRLMKDELVELIPHRGIIVRQLNYRDVIEIYTVREYLEGLAARLVAQKKEEDLKPLKRISEQNEHLANVSEIMHFMQFNIVFHSTVVTATDNFVLVKTLERLNAQLVAFQFLRLMGRIDVVKAMEQHRQILTAIFKGDAEGAEALMRSHIRSSLEIVKESFSPTNPYLQNL